MEMEQIQVENHRLREEIEELRNEIKELKQHMTDYKEEVRSLVIQDVRQSTGETFKYINDTQREMIKEIYREAFGETLHEMKESFKELKDATVTEVGALLRESKKEAHTGRYDDQQNILPKEEIIVAIKEEVVKCTNIAQSRSIEEIEKAVIEKMRKDEDRQRRANNVIVFNLEETNANTQEEFDRAEQDKIGGLLVQGVGYANWQATDIVRLGKRRENLCRPVLVRFLDTGQKWNIIKRAKNLNASEEYKSIRIVPDLSLDDRKKEKKLYIELKNKRERGEKGWFISKGELVQRNF